MFGRLRYKEDTKKEEKKDSSYWLPFGMSIGLAFSKDNKKNNK